MRRVSARRHIAIGVLLASTLALAACQGRSARLDDADTMTTASTAPVSIRQAAEAGKRWEADQDDVGLGLEYAGRLKGMGQTDRQLAVLRTLAQRNPKDTQLLALYGKELAQNGKSAEAAAVLEQAVATGKADWKTYSALGSAYDQQSRHAEARSQYEQALQLKPNEVGVLNNLGMSYALEGNLTKAEETLRQAYALPAGQRNSRVRQNLALVVGLSGRYDESRQIASQDLPPAEVEANMAYLRKMMDQEDTWQKLKTEEAG